MGRMLPSPSRAMTSRKFWGPVPSVTSGSPKTCINNTFSVLEKHVIWEKLHSLSLLRPPMILSKLPSFCKATPFNWQPCVKLINPEGQWMIVDLLRASPCRYYRKVNLKTTFVLHVCELLHISFIAFSHVWDKECSEGMIFFLGGGVVWQGNYSRIYFFLGRRSSPKIGDFTWVFCWLEEE